MMTSPLFPERNDLILIAAGSPRTSTFSGSQNELIAESLLHQAPELAERVVYLTFPDDNDDITHSPRKRITLPTTTATGSLTEAHYTFFPYYLSSPPHAIIDVAAASGIAQVKNTLSPLTADTYGTGVLIADALARGSARITLCLGDSAATDGGTGILIALGATLHDAGGRTLSPGGGALSTLAYVDTTFLNPQASTVQWEFLTDTSTPPTGNHGSAITSGPQKGATADESVLLDRGISRLCEVLDVDPHYPGYGAAGALPVSIHWLSTRYDPAHIPTMLTSLTTVDPFAYLDALLPHTTVFITTEETLKSSPLREHIAETLRVHTVPTVLLTETHTHEKPTPNDNTFFLSFDPTADTATRVDKALAEIVAGLTLN